MHHVIFHIIINSFIFKTIYIYNYIYLFLSICSCITFTLHFHLYVNLQYLSSATRCL